MGDKSGESWILEAREVRVSIRGTCQEYPTKVRYAYWITSSIFSHSAPEALATRPYLCRQEIRRVISAKSDQLKRKTENTDNGGSPRT